jgi:5-methylcytosine-specific restriction endonuclease McrA
MNFVDGNKKTTLILSAGYQPIGFLTARATIRNLMVGVVKAVDLNGIAFTWDEWVKQNQFGVSIPEDGPKMRSASAAWDVPTIVVIPGYYGNHRARKKPKTITLKQLFRVYKGVCQYCLKDIPSSKATKDHVVPRSKGGSDYATNLVLACKACNSKKADSFPWANKLGQEVKPAVLNEFEFSTAVDNIQIRKEWEIFFEKKH